MPAAYSYDLRKKAMSCLEAGESRLQVATHFKIGATTLYEWQQRLKETGDFIAKKPGSAGYNHKITNWEKFKNFAKLNGDKTQSEMAFLWDGAISRQKIHLALRKIGFSRKKRLTGIKNVMMQNA
jgi:transposase